MVPADAGQLVEQLDVSAVEETRLAATRALKNAVIGNKTKKALYLDSGVVPILVSIVGDPGRSSSELIVHAAAALGSISCGFPPGAQQVLESGALDVLLEAMEIGSPSVIEAAARSLNIIFISASKDERLKLLQSWAPYRLNFLVGLVSTDQPEVVESACSILAACCIRQQEQDQLHEKGTTKAAIKVLFSTRHPRVQHCALECVSKLVENNVLVGDYLAGRPDLVLLIVKFARDQRPPVRLLACSVLSSLLKGGFLDNQDDISKAEVSAIVIPALVKLFDNPSTRIEAPMVLGFLVADSEQLQKAACDADALNRIISIIRETPSVDPKLLGSALRTLAGLTSSREESRKVVLDSQLLPIIVASLKSSNPALQVAAALCLRSLSRSVKALRSSLGDNCLVEPLLKILASTEAEVQLAALGSLCNLVLEFSVMKDEVVKQGGLETIVKLSKSPSSEIRVNATWSLKNLVYKASPELKEKVMDRLSFEALDELLSDEDSLVQEQAMTLLRNLACSESGEQQQVDLEHLVQGMGKARLINAIHEGLHSSRLETVTQAVYLAVNIASGTEKYKSMIADSTLLGDLKRLFSDTDHRVREGAIWCLINLVWFESHEPIRESTRLRIVRFQDEGFEGELDRLMRNDSHNDVKERAKDALIRFQNGIGGTGGRPVQDAEPMQY